MGAIFIPATDKSIYIVSLEDGRQLGSISLNEPATTPCAVSESLITISEFGKSLSVRNWVDGRKVWAVDLYGAESEPLLYNGLLYWQDGKRILHCFSLIEGKRVWERPLDFEAAAAPAACSVGLALVDVNGATHFLSLDGERQLWSLETGARIRNSPLLTGEYLYYSTVDGKLGKINVIDGLKSWETALESQFIAPPASDGEAVFLGTSSGMLIRINAQDGSRGWQLQLGGPISAGISIAGEFIIAADLNRRVYIVDKHNGAIRFEHETEGMISARPVVCGNRIYVAGEDKNLYCLRISEKE